MFSSSTLKSLILGHREVGVEGVLDGEEGYDVSELKNEGVLKV